MVTRRLRELLLAFAMLPIFVQPTLAHVVWFGPEDRGPDYELIFGHPESGSEPYEVSGFQEAAAYDTNKQVVPVKITKQDQVSIDPQGDFAALTAFFDNGYWLQTSADEYENISQEQAEAVEYKDVTRYLKYTKALYDWSEPISQPLGLPLEIMPLQNPLAVEAGEALPIQVLHQGELAQDPLVEYLGKVVDINDQGTAYIPVGQGGLDVIEASYDSPSATNPGVSYATSFTAVPEPSPLLGLGAFGLLVLARKQLKQLKRVNLSK